MGRISIELDTVNQVAYELYKQSLELENICGIIRGIRASLPQGTGESCDTAMTLHEVEQAVRLAGENTRSISRLAARAVEEYRVLEQRLQK